ncbi:COQ9-domain-containing protein [Hyaloraphidium curvatum]|nr:COQ9-domain-containing protein [Hyaloraphidium curvatum]
MDGSNPPTPSSHSSAPQDLPSDPTTPILRAALLAVPRLGWSDAALRHGAAETGLPTVSASGLFPRGPVQLVEYFLATALDEAGREMSGMDVSKMGTTQKIRLGCVTRLEKTMPYAETWHEAIALLVLPGNVLSASLHLANLANVIWNFAGDQANDVSWYTKSAMLGAVYSSTELFMVEDKSPGRAETKAFLDRRLADVEALGSLRSEVESVLGFVARSLAGAAEAHGLIKR